VHRFSYGTLNTGISYIRYMTAEDREFFPVAAEPTVGTANSQPMARGLRITEILYNPAPPVISRDIRTAPPDLEFIEISNPSQQEVSMVGYRITGLDYTFTSADTVPAQGYLILTPSDATAFRARYQLPELQPVIGGIPSLLDDKGEHIRLETAAADANGNPGFVPVEELRYDNRGPWPTHAAGLGDSLQRYASRDYAAEASAWVGAAPSPGWSQVFNAAPRVTFKQVLTTGKEIHFQATAVDPEGGPVTLGFYVDGGRWEITQDSSTTFRYQRSRGIHEAWVDATDAEGNATVSAFITIDDGDLPVGAGDGLKAEYFTNTDLSGAPTHVEAPAQRIGGSWFHLDPAPGVSRAAFSSRFSGQIRPGKTGDHIFSIQRAGGVRVWLNGELVLEEWADPLGGAITASEITLPLTADIALPFVIEYLETDGHGHLSMEWQQPGVFGLQPIGLMQIYQPDQDPQQPSIAPPPSLSLRQLRQRVSLQMSVLETDVPQADIRWSVIAGAMPPGLSINSSGKISGRTYEQGTFTYTLQADLGGGRLLTRQLTTRVISNSGRPTLKVVSPTGILNTQRYAPIVLSGNISHAQPLKRIEYQVNGSVWRSIPLPPGSQWSVSIPADYGIQAGGNQVIVRAEDTAGAMSAEVGIHFIRYYSSTLTVRVEGSGTVTRGFLGTTQRVAGKEYTLTATPAPGWIFIGWSGSTSQQERQFTFYLGDEFELVAQFERSPYVGIEGSYLSYYPATDPLNHQPILLSMQLATDGAITGVISVINQRLPFRGYLNPTLGFSTFQDIPAAQGQFSLGLTWNRETLAILAELYVSRNSDGQLRITQQPLQPRMKTAPAEQVGRWNSLSTRITNEPSTRQSFFTTVIGKDGSVLLTGMTEDGRRFTSSSFLVAPGVAPFYSPLLRATQERTISGYVNAGPARPDMMQISLWDTSCRDFNPGPDDFHLDLGTIAHRWRAPLRGASPWPMSQGIFDLAHEVTPFAQRIGLGTSSIVSFTNPATGTKVTLMADPTTGLIRGIATPRSGPRLQLQGIITPSDIGGSFMYPNQTVGFFNLRPSR
jgi:hypothetical protein